MRRTAPVKPSPRPSPDTKPKPKPVQKVQIIEFKRSTPTQYTPTTPERVLALAKLGLTIAAMAEMLEVAKATLEHWLAHKPEVRAAYDRGKWIHDHAVELALQERALGFEYEEERRVDGVDAIGRPYSYTTRTTKRVVGDTTAQIFWLKNRDPQRWRNVDRDTSTNLTQVNLNNTLNLAALTPEQRELVQAIALKQIEEMGGSGDSTNSTDTDHDNTST